MKKVNGRALIRLFLAVAMMAGGCSFLSPQPDRSRYFVLVPSADSHSVAPAALISSRHRLTIGLGPITIPHYLDRPEVVTRLSQTELFVSDNDRWAEPLDTCVTRILAQDLSMDFPDLQIVPFPWSKTTRIDYKVSVEFHRLEKTADGKADVQATWNIRNGLTNSLIQGATTTASRPAGSDQSSASAALSEGIGQVSREIVQALKHQSQLQANISRQTRL